MARTRSPKSTYPFGGLGLKPAEDEKLIAHLSKKELPLKRLLRQLVRDYMKKEGL